MEDWLCIICQYLSIESIKHQRFHVKFFHQNIVKARGVLQILNSVVTIDPRLLHKDQCHIKAIFDVTLASAILYMAEG